jgi:hypothetical protein
VEEIAGQEEGVDLLPAPSLLGDGQRCERAFSVRRVEVNISEV